MLEKDGSRVGHLYNKEEQHPYTTTVSMKCNDRVLVMRRNTTYDLLGAGVLDYVAHGFVMRIEMLFWHRDNESNSAMPLGVSMFFHDSFLKQHSQIVDCFHRCLLNNHNIWI